MLYRKKTRRIVLDVPRGTKGVERVQLFLMDIVINTNNLTYTHYDPITVLPDLDIDDFIDSVIGSDL